MTEQQPYTKTASAAMEGFGYLAMLTGILVFFKHEEPAPSIFLLIGGLFVFGATTLLLLSFWATRSHLLPSAGLRWIGGLLCSLSSAAMLLHVDYAIWGLLPSSVIMVIGLWHIRKSFL